MPILTLKAVSERMPDFKTVNPGDRIKLPGDMMVVVLSVESSTSMTVRTLEPWEQAKVQEN